MMIEKVMLVKVSSTNNNNKFYELQLHEDGTVFKRWGRVGTDGQKGQDHSGKRGFDRLLKAKTSKGYKEVKVAGTQHQNGPRVNREEIRKASREALAKDKQDQAVISLIDALVERNKHEIIEASDGLIQVNSSGIIETALGIIEPASLTKASALLNKLEADKYFSSSFQGNLEAYLTLVPQKVSASRGWEKTFFRDNPFDKQRNLLQQLEQSYQWYESEKAAINKTAQNTTQEVDYKDFFRYRVSSLSCSEEGDKIFDYVNTMFKKSRKRMHTTYHKKLHKVYILEDNQSEEDFNYTSEQLGNSKELWHGTNTANILSILSRGLILPKDTDLNIDVTGAMFGPGLYFSESSSKSLNYSNLYWSNGPNQKTCFMFLNDVICGKEFFPRHYSEWKKSRQGYNSICANPGASIINHEQIVWNTNQVKLKYLCEFID